MKKWILTGGLAAWAALAPSGVLAAAPTLSIADASGFEYDLGETNTLTFTVTLTPSSTQVVSVAYCTFNGSAQAGNDYIALPVSTLVFQPGQTSKTIPVQLIGDNVFETNEVFYVQLFSATNAGFAGGAHFAQAAGTIVDDDAITIASTYDFENDTGVTNHFVFQVRLAQPQGVPVSVAYTTVDGSAATGSDYLAASGVMTFAPGQTNQNVVVSVLGDIYHEFEEVFHVRLTSSTNSTGILVRDKQADGTIVDDDHYFFLTLYPATANEGTPGVETNRARFLVRLNQPSTNTVTVNYQTFNTTISEVGYFFDAYQAIEEYTNFIPSFVFNGSLTPARAGTDYQATSGTLTFAPGETAKHVEVSLLGNATPEADKPFILHLSGAVNAEIYNDGTAVGVIVDDDAFGTPVVTISNEAVTEGDHGDTNRVMWFHIQLNSVRHTPFSISFTNAVVSPNGATAGLDYQGASGSLFFPNGVADQYIPVTIFNDNLNETNEVFRVRLTTPAGVYWASNATYGGIGTIIDNDPLPYLTVSSYTNYEGDTVNNTAQFMVKLSAPSGREVKVTYATANGSATAGSDYKTKSGTLTIPAGVVTSSIPVTVYGDVLPEADETFLVNLTKPVNATIAVAQGQGIIRNDDTERFINISNVQAVEGNSDSTNVIFIVSLSSPCPQPVTVDYTTVNGSAAGHDDYDTKSGALIFPPGVTNQTISVAVHGEITPEADEVFYVDLSNPFNASLGAASRGAGTIVNDDGVPGRVHRFAWSAIAATQFASQPFAVTITALDISNQIVTSFSQPVSLVGAVRLIGESESKKMIGDLDSQFTHSGHYTLGFRFTPSTNLLVTHLRHFVGSKISLWTDSGNLLVSQSVSDVPGSWTETALVSPVELTGGQTYRLGYLVSGVYHYRSPKITNFADGVIIQNLYGAGDGMPTINFNAQNFVDLRYTRLSAIGSAPIAITPIMSGTFTNGEWAGMVAVTQTATNAFLTATDNDGHTGSSASFNVTNFTHMVGSLAYEMVSATNGSKHFKLLTTDGRAYVIERSTDLINWTPIYTNLTGLSGCDCLDAMSATGTRFYRARRYLVAE